jgi:hypothetical protein
MGSAHPGAAVRTTTSRTVTATAAPAWLVSLGSLGHPLFAPLTEELQQVGELLERQNVGALDQKGLHRTFARLFRIPRATPMPSEVPFPTALSSPLLVAFLQLGLQPVECLLHRLPLIFRELHTGIDLLDGQSSSKPAFAGAFFYSGAREKHSIAERTVGGLVLLAPQARKADQRCHCDRGEAKERGIGMVSLLHLSSLLRVMSTTRPLISKAIYPEDLSEM